MKPVLSEMEKKRIFRALYEANQNWSEFAVNIEAAVLEKLADKLRDAERYTATKAMLFGESKAAWVEFDSGIDAKLIARKAVKL